MRLDRYLTGNLPALASNPGVPIPKRTVTQPGIAAILSRVLWKEIQYERVGNEQQAKDVVQLIVPHLVQHVHEVAIDRRAVCS